MHRIAIVALAVVLTCTCVRAESLEEAIQKHAAQIEEAKRPVADCFAELIVDANKTGNTAKANRFIEYSERFSNGGIMYLPDGSTAMPVLYKKYGAALKAAGDELQKAYVKEMTEATAKKDFATLNALTAKLETHRLPGKLVSFQTPQANSFLNHWGLLLRAGPLPNEAEKMNATFELRAGLDNPEFVSIHSVNFPTSFVDHFGFRLRLTDYQDDKIWKAHATWNKLPGLSDPKGGVSFESVTHPGRYIRIRPNGEAWLDPLENNIGYKKSATFVVKPGVYKLW
ncbi:MAG: Extracellular exo-alpha-(1-_5)-L-arabinofuranosidase [Schlesneria sp.]|nr:Extracellular exo-alpha-(1->5)-L-arabinofuranosidase [Schlesneria sp.]